MVSVPGGAQQPHPPIQPWAVGDFVWGTSTAGNRTVAGTIASISNGRHRVQEFTTNVTISCFATCLRPWYPDPEPNGRDATDAHEQQPARQSPGAVDEPFIEPWASLSLGERLDRLKTVLSCLPVSALSAVEELCSELKQKAAARRIQALYRGVNTRTRLSPRLRILRVQRAATDHMAASHHQAAIESYSEAIRLFTASQNILSIKLLAELKASRASALLKLGAYDAACSEFESAVELYPMIIVDAESSEVELVWQPAHCLQMARAFVLSGQCKRANDIYQDILRAADALQDPKATSQGWVAEATMGQAEAERLRESVKEAELCLQKQDSANAWAHLQTALAIAPGSKDLIKWKLFGLAALQRWRELVGFLERMACLYASIENVYQDDLAKLAPSPGISPVQTLDPKLFGEVLNESALTAGLTLPVESVPEAVLRLPYSLLRYYICGLRLEGRYPAASAALATLSNLVELGTMKHDSYSLAAKFFPWLAKESDMLKRTQEAFQRGNAQYQEGKFEDAANEYAAALKIDLEVADELGLPLVNRLNAGGRRHAELHYYRAMCFWSLKNTQETLQECNHALEIHPQYMSVLRFQSRCFFHRGQYDEAIAGFNQWICMVKEAEKSPASKSSIICVHQFDLPQDVPADDLKYALRELEYIEEKQRLKEQAWRQQTQHQQSSQERSGRSQAQDSTTGGSPSFRSRSTERENTHPNNRGEERGSRRRSFSTGNLPKNHYEVLGLSTNATQDDIKRSYRRLALKYHPDKNRVPAAAARELWDPIQKARDVLGEPTTRQAYDLSLNSFP
jgi:tetratricopeptide (TPR) repeat protein